MGSHTWIIEPDVEDLKNKMKELYTTKKIAVPRSDKIKTWETVGAMYGEALNKIHAYPRVKRVHGN